MAAAPSSFLQQAVLVDPSSKRMTVLGEVDERFTVSPNIEQLLGEIERSRVDDVKAMEVDG
jgi:DNA-directed RNA polymerase III subunit RPC4